MSAIAIAVRAESNRYQRCFIEIYRANAEELHRVRAADKFVPIPEGSKSLEEMTLSRIRKEAVAIHEANEELGYLQRINPTYLATPPPRRHQTPIQRYEEERDYENERCYQQCFIEVYFANAEQIYVTRAADKAGYTPESCNSIEDIILSNIRKEAIDLHQAKKERRHQDAIQAAIRKASLAVQEIRRQDALEQEYLATAAYLEQRAPAPAGSSTLVERLRKGK
jgi:hypothetical protein